MWDWHNFHPTALEVLLVENLEFPNPSVAKYYKLYSSFLLPNTAHFGTVNSGDLESLFSAADNELQCPQGFNRFILAYKQ